MSSNRKSWIPQSKILLSWMSAFVTKSDEQRRGGGRQNAGTPSAWKSCEQSSIFWAVLDILRANRTAVSVHPEEVLTFQPNALGTAVLDNHVADLEAVEGGLVAPRTGGVLALGCVGGAGCVRQRRERGVAGRCFLGGEPEKSGSRAWSVMPGSGQTKLAAIFRPQRRRDESKN